MLELNLFIKENEEMTACTDCIFNINWRLNISINSKFYKLIINDKNNTIYIKIIKKNITNDN